MATEIRSVREYMVSSKTPIGTLVGYIQDNNWVLGGMVLEGFLNNGREVIVSDYWGNNNLGFRRTMEFPIERMQITYP